MKIKRIIFKITNICLFLYYLVISLGFAAGINILSYSEGESTSVINQDNYYNKLYSNPWEINETVCLGLIILNNIRNLIFRKKRSLLSYVCVFLPIIIFVLKLIAGNVTNAKIESVMILFGFLRIYFLYMSFLYNQVEKGSIIKLFYRNYKKENFTQENSDILSDRIGEDKGKNFQMIAPLPINNQNADKEIFIMNNVSPLKNSQIKSPRRVSIMNDVQNKLPLLLVEKVKIPKFINLQSTNEDNQEINNSGDTLDQHSFLDEISIIYHNNNQNINEKHSAMITELNRIPDINFNVFKLSQNSEGSELFVVMCHLMHLYKFTETIQVNKKSYKNYFYLINKTYRKNPYHNSIHGCDVTQTLYFILKTCNIDTICNLNDLEIFSCFFASAVHDLDHPGNNNNYEIAVGSTLAISYNDKAVLENYHLCKAFSLLKKGDCDVFANFSRNNYNISRAIIINMVLSTDMANHFLDLTLTKNRVNSGDYNPAGSDKQLMINQLIHAADISNPLKPMDIYKEWIRRVFIEFYDQGDKEREKGLKISYLCDRYSVNVIDAQLGFIDNIVFPLFNTLSGAFPNMKMISNLINNNKEELMKMKSKGEVMQL